MLDVDPHLASVIATISAEPLVKDKWFNFGYNLYISVNQLSTIECRLQNYTQYTREVVILWRKKNMSETWIPVAQALHSAELHRSEQQIIQHFIATEGKYIDFHFFGINFISSSDTDKLKNYRLCTVPHERSLEEIASNAPVQEGINNSVL